MSVPFSLVPIYTCNFPLPNSVLFLKRKIETVFTTMPSRFAFSNCECQLKTGKNKEKAGSAIFLVAFVTVQKGR